MLTPEELSSIRKKIDEEYAMDIRALERLSRFIPNEEKSQEDTTPKGSGIAIVSVQGSVDPNAALLTSGSQSILGGLEDILSRHRDRTWTGQQLKAELGRGGHEIHALKPMATIGVAMKKLLDRGKVSVVRRGSGREPHIYQWNKVDLANCAVIEEEPEAA